MNFAGAGLIVLSADMSSILLVHDTRSGKWGFPKGHREAVDSNDMATAVRECFEETGLTPDDYTIYGDNFKINKGGQSYLFRYAILKNESRKDRLRAGPAYEIAALDWVPLNRLFEAQIILDGNKYLRTWVADVKANSSKKSVHVFKALLGECAARAFPAQETMSPCNIVTCS